MEEILTYVTRVSLVRNQDWVQDNLNEFLRLIVENPEYHRTRYDEYHANFDPYHKRVLEGVCKGLTMASIDFERGLTNKLFYLSQQNTTFNSDLMPYQPDLIVGLNGRKVLLSVISAQNTMTDTQKADGNTLFR